VTNVAYDCAMLGIPADTWRLFDGEDLNYALWLDVVCDRVHATKQEQEERAKHS
jgi:hypothetical protein